MNVIEVENLSYRYPDGTVALKNITFCVKANQTLSIIGPNGAGKTTLLLALCGILKPEGEIKIFGKNINKNSFELRKKIGFVFEDPNNQLFMPKVFDDIAFGPVQFEVDKKEIPKLVKEALSAVGLEGFEERIPHHLSLGEKKRVALATAIVLKPEILILDEPTNNLDPATKREFKELIKNFNCTKIIAGHDLELIKELSDRIIVINNGQKIAEGPPSEIFSNTLLLTQNRLM